MELRESARAVGALTHNILPDGTHLTQRETAALLFRSGPSPLYPLTCNTMAPDEGNVFRIGHVPSAEQAPVCMGFAPTRT